MKVATERRQLEIAHRLSTDEVRDAYRWSGDAKIPRRNDYAKGCLFSYKGMSSFLGNRSGGCQKNLGKMERGCKNFRDSSFPVTPNR